MSYLLPGSIGVHSMTHWGKPDPSGKGLPPVPLLIGGIDTTETTKVFLEHTKAMWAGEPIDEAEYERRMTRPTLCRAPETLTAGDWAS
jgi:hypothetical protein